MVSKFDGLNWLNNQSGVKAGIRSNEDFFSWARVLLDMVLLIKIVLSATVINESLKVSENKALALIIDFGKQRFRKQS